MGATDCEVLRDGLIAQPANTLSSLAFVVVGAWIVVRGHRSAGHLRPWALLFGAAVAANGVGSVAFHGPGTAAGRWVHDLAIVAVLLVVIAYDTAALRRWSFATGTTVVAVGLLAAGGLLAVAPASSSYFLALAIPAAVAEVAVYRAGLRTPPWQRMTRAPAFYGVTAVLAVGAVAGTLGRTDGLLCRPESWAQGHALFHVAMAVVLGAWAVSAGLATVATEEAAP